MKNLLLSFLFFQLCITAQSQCENVAIQISSSTETSVNLYHAGFFNIPSGFDNICNWEVTDFSGAIVHQETTSGDWGDQSFSLFNHSVPITDSMKVTLLINNATSGITCFMSDTLFWEFTEVLPGSFIANWAVLSSNPGSEITLALELAFSNDVSCFGGNDGSISVVASGGEAPYGYSIDNGPVGSSSDFTGLGAGTHIIIVTDNIGATTSLTVVLDGSDELILDVNGTNVSCFEGDDGEVFALASGGNSSNGYNYFINGDGPFNTGLFTELSAGTYEILVEDGNACLTSQTVVLTASDQISVDSLELINLSCYYDSNGSVDFNVSGGVVPYIFKYSDQDSLLSLPITNLSAGEYSVTISDQNACTLVVDFEILSPDTLLLMVENIVNDNCDVDNLGSVSLIGVGGTPGYSYSLNGLLNTSGVFDSLASGNYIANVVDANGCTVEVSVSIGLDTDFDVSYDITNPNCQSDSTGMISVIIAGGNDGYTFFLNQIDMQTSEFEGLSAGIYEISVESNNGCVFTDTLSLIEVSNLSFDSLIVLNINCGTEEYGMVQVSAIGGSGELAFTLNGQSNNTGVFADLEQGSYTLSVMDDAGCSYEEQIEINVEGVPAASIESIQDISCFGMVDGAVTILANGGTSGYEFQLDSMINTTGMFSGLPAGTYLATIISVQNCISEIEFVIEDVDELILELVSVVNSDGTGNGSITVAATGGTEPYQYSIDGGISFQDDSMFSGLNDDMYTVLIQDANNCTDEVIVLVTATEENILNTNISVYPSPAQSGADLNIKSNDIIESISIVNTQGQLVSNKVYNETSISISTIELSKGVYILGIKTKQGVSWQKVAIN